MEVFDVVAIYVFLLIDQASMSASVRVVSCLSCRRIDRSMHYRLYRRGIASEAASEAAVAAMAYDDDDFSIRVVILYAGTAASGASATD